MGRKLTVREPLWVPWSFSIDCFWVADIGMTVKRAYPGEKCFPLLPEELDYFQGQNAKVALRGVVLTNLIGAHIDPAFDVLDYNRIFNQRLVGVEYRGRFTNQGIPECNIPYMSRITDAKAIFQELEKMINAHRQI